MSTGFFFHKNSHIRIISWLWGHRTFRWAAMTNPPKGSPLWHLEIPKEEQLPAHEDEEAHVVHCFFSCLSYSQFASLHNPFGPKPWRCTKSADLRSAVSPGEKSVKSLGIEAPDLWWWTLLPITFTRIVELRKVAVAIICGLLKKAPKHLEKKRWGCFFVVFWMGWKNLDKKRWNIMWFLRCVTNCLALRLPPPLDSSAANANPANFGDV